MDYCYEFNQSVNNLPKYLQILKEIHLNFQYKYLNLKNYIENLKLF